MATPALPHKSRRPSSSTQASSQQSSESEIGPFRKLSHIGKGSFAEVYRGIHVERKQTVAIKSVNMAKLNKKLKENLLSEISILKSLHHPHIVALIGCQEAPAKMHIIMEFCELGDLSAFIKKRSSLGDHPETRRMIQKYPNPAVGGLNEVTVRHFTKQMASALEFLRSKNYIHRDLKPQNLLLNPSSLYYARNDILDRMPMSVDANSLIPAAGIESLPMLKIADFGFARLLPTTSLAETLCGSPLYMAPEILRYEKYDAKADLWSVGTVLYEMMCGRPPFRANNHVELLRRIEERKDHIKFVEGVVISRVMKNLIRALLKKVPTERMSYDSFFKDPVICDEIPGLVGEDRAPEPELEAPLQPKSVQKLPADAQQRMQDSPYSQSPRERTSFGTTPPSRPNSRPTSGQNFGTPPRPTSARRFSNAQMHVAEPQGPSQKERRPTFTSAATAPTRPTVIQDRNPVPAAIAMDRRNSRNSPSPTSSMLKEHLDRERIPQRADERALRDARERAAQDIAFERDYVLVEKRRVEIDALADEFAASPQTTRERPSSPKYGAMVRRATTQGSPTSTPGAANPSRAIQIASKRQHPDALHQRNASYERRYRPSFESATSALSKAMNMVNIRGLGLSPPLMKGVSPPQGYSAFPTYPTAQSSLLLVGDAGKTSIKDEDTRMISAVEDLAQRSHVVFGFAEVKYKQLIPAPPSDQGLGIEAANMVRRPSGQDDADDDDDELTVDVTLLISEEALVLYVKSLGILNRAMDLAGSWWNRRQRTVPSSETASLRSNPSSGNSTAHADRMNHVVQWVRNRFNECCDKADFVAQKLQDTQKQLPADHPNHPNNRSSGSGSNTTLASAGNIHLTTGVTAEKLMYERALEMSRAAAVNELVGQDLPGCEINYWTAIRMLEAIIEVDDDSPPRGRSDDDNINGLEDEDRQSVIKLLESMKARLKALKRKIEAQKASKRLSTGNPVPHPSRRSSPSSGGVAR
ncbi:Serine/threonine-protein kinase atg1 [Mytilinidion resinicola]|uniref:non-specific serine/threonine protein kinase n=1 Tax=Mytilinidion resinicola TaxID=574789 RepID=A0A6A6YPP9_9PEZI|nr:Serine/threonine-protein kinase atg1 [Mytilinidion resinicola]KAF2809955.1 Serine/threonine-protein kinase atg1 [Mytilinidion resinicola]